MISKGKTENITRKWCLIFGRDGLDVSFWCGWMGDDFRMDNNYVKVIFQPFLSAPRTENTNFGGTFREMTLPFRSVRWLAARKNPDADFFSQCVRPNTND